MTGTKFEESNLPDALL